MSAYNFLFVTEQMLSQAQPTTFSSAPKAVKKLVDAVDAATTEHMNATDAVSDAEMALPITQAAWDTAGRDAVRAGKPLPSRDPLDTAKFELSIAVEDEKVSGLKERNAISALAGMLGQAEVRAEWLAGITARITDLDATLTTAANNLNGVVTEKTVAVGMSHYIGQWCSQSSPENYLHPVDPVGALHAAANLKAYQDPTPALPSAVVRNTQPAAADTRPAVWIVNDGGSVVDVAPASADRLVAQDGWRMATDAEATRQAARNAGRR